MLQKEQTWFTCFQNMSAASENVRGTIKEYFDAGHGYDVIYVYTLCHSFGNTSWHVRLFLFVWRCCPSCSKVGPPVQSATIHVAQGYLPFPVWLMSLSFLFCRCVLHFRATVPDCRGTSYDLPLLTPLSLFSRFFAR